jgi:leucyl/phenylalanyl-tRNA---protein transferase
MPIYELNKEIMFPPVRGAEPSGILAVGGDLSPERLLLAYRSGIFPWYSDDDPIIWWSPDPRFVLFPEELYVSRTMRQVLARKIFDITLDRDFRGVIRGCREPRKKERGTWITDEMMEAYIRLHDLGFAHSAEAWQDGELVGGLYGISLGGCFFGESMFTRASNASKAAFIALVKRLRDLGFIIIDSQVYTGHLETLGARHIPRAEYLGYVNRGLTLDTIRGSWKDLLENDPG